ncbi:hypothetical protein C8Q80DRAFT_1267374 [Daedaleopsis nitida]|nr:hypothetical protein C8Q80DRAFT_1267374 [Daedaleopsis nitida]
MTRAFNDTPDSDVLVDDSNIDLIRYIDLLPSMTTFVYNWTHVKSNTEPLLLYNETVSTCLQSGCMALFTFYGTRVVVYGSEAQPVSSVSVWSSYSVDGQTNYTHLSGTQPADHLLLYQSEEMPYAQHTLFIYVARAEDDVGYTLDWIEYNTTSRSSDDGSAISSETPPLSSSPSSSSLSASISPASWSSAAFTATQVSSTANVKLAVSGGIIATVTICSLAAVLGVLIALFWWRRAHIFNAVKLQHECPGEHQDIFATNLPPPDPSPTYSLFTSTTMRASVANERGNTEETQELLIPNHLTSGRRHGASLTSDHSHGDLLETSDGRTPPLYGGHEPLVQALGGKKGTYLALEGTTLMIPGVSELGPS